MKKLFYLVVMCASMLWSCDKDDDGLDVDNPNGKEGVITMVAKTDKIEYLQIYSFKEGETITIDWGDGMEEKFKTVAEYDEDDGEFYGYWTDDLEHSYSNSNPHTITIKGNIKELYCYENSLTSLDVSKNTALTDLDCEGNDLTSLDVSKNTALTGLGCSGNNLTSLNVSGCTALTYLDCSDNNLTSLDVSKCTALTDLFCYNNSLTSLNVSGCSALTDLSCYYNNLTSLDVSKCTALTELDCEDNNFSATALNRIFNDLPKGKTWIGEYNGEELQSYIRIYNNPGSKTCDTSIAENKGWKVYNN